jgi:hypothetical protein
LKTLFIAMALAVSLRLFSSALYAQSVSITLEAVDGKNGKTMPHQRLLVFMGDSQEDVRFHKYSQDVTTDERGYAVLHICTDLRGSKAGGTLDRRTGVGALRCRGSIMRRRSTSWLKYGPRNYSHAIQTERMGLIREATLDGRALANWEHLPLPMEDLKQLRFLAEPCTGPCFYEATFNSASPADTYVDTGHLHKGQFWLNEHNIGRFRAVGRFTRSTRRSRGCSAIQIALHSSI